MVTIFVRAVLLPTIFMVVLLTSSFSAEFIEKRIRTCRDNELCDSCTPCASGFETSQPCTETMDTVCLQCVHGVTFNPVVGTHVACRPCKGCPINSRLKRGCNVTHNTECECERDFYIDLKAGSCRPCDVCTHGWGAARPCSALHNTVCRTCPFGTYNNLVSSTLGCMPCTQCREDQYIVHQCTAIQDTICEDSEATMSGRMRSSVEPHSDKEETSDSVIAVYCALLASVVFGLLLYVTVKQCRAKPPVKSGGSAAACLSAPLCPPRVTPVDMEIPSSRSDRRTGFREFHPVVVVNESGKEYKAAYQETRLRDVSIVQRRELEILLDTRSGSDWRLLAETLGYSPSRISVLEQRALEKQISPARCLLSDWSKREDSSVQDLAEALSEIGRHDVALILMHLTDGRFVNRSSARQLDVL